VEVAQPYTRDSPEVLNFYHEFHGDTARKILTPNAGCSRIGSGARNREGFSATWPQLLHIAPCLDLLDFLYYPGWQGLELPPALPGDDETLPFIPPRSICASDASPRPWFQFPRAISLNGLVISRSCHKKESVAQETEVLIGRLDNAFNHYA
jgi:hypothetical protein